ncbi:MAG: 3-phosphoserine/phosphohydroxythreonine transaminase, partial [Bacteroidota bacterium]|nr:3-phosphoserine/phosphohydroxythreonine transaminase [Bacteroidota bacterium]
MKHNFSAGPCILPAEVMEKSSQAIVDYNNTGLSLIEISHRSQDFIQIMDKAVNLSISLLGLEGKGYKALFLQGGASLQFISVAYNLLSKKSGYCNTGTWSKKALNEARILGDVTEVCSSEDKNFNYIPKGYQIPSDLDYLHITTNNTIFGTQYKNLPDCNTLLVADCSSDIFSRDIDYSNFDLLYAGAQKNMGPAGTTLVVVKEEILGRVKRKIPSMLDYRVHIDKDSMFNTPPVFAVYTSLLNLQWLSSNGGIKSIEKINKVKAQTIYSEIDSNPLFDGFANKEDRSMRNATFTLNEPKLKETFDSMALEAGLSGINGH